MAPRRADEPGRIAIGVTGHRVLAELAKVEAGVDKAVRRIEQKFSQELLTVLSSLALAETKVGFLGRLRRAHWAVPLLCWFPGRRITQVKMAKRGGSR